MDGRKMDGFGTERKIRTCFLSKMSIISIYFVKVMSHESCRRKLLDFFFKNKSYAKPFFYKKCIIYLLSDTSVYYS